MDMIITGLSLWPFLPIELDSAFSGPSGHQAHWHSEGQEGPASVTAGLNPMRGTGAISAASLQK